jgi:tetratricopeptide (TPR) repeat protein
MRKLDWAGAWVSSVCGVSQALCGLRDAIDRGAPVRLHEGSRAGAKQLAMSLRLALSFVQDWSESGTMASTPFRIRSHRASWRAALFGTLLAICVSFPRESACAEPADSASPSDPSVGVTIRRMLESGGMPAEKAERFSKALEKAMEDEELEPLIPWLSDADERIELVSATAMIGIDSEKAEPRLIKMIKSRKKPRDPLIVALGASERKETIDFLVQRAAKIEDLSDEAEFAALQVRTGRAFRKGRQWTDWWKEGRAKFKRQPVSDFFEFFGRLQAVHLDKAFGKLNAAFKDMGLGSLGNLVDSMARGRAMEFSEETLRGVAHFCRGELDDARKAYAKAVELDQFDRVALIDLACLQLEANRYDEAAKSLQRLEVLIPNSPLIGDLQKLAEGKVPNNEWLDTLEASLRSDAKKYDILSEPLFEFLTTRSVSSAKLVIPSAVFEEILADVETPFELQLGAALASPRMAVPTWLALIRTRFLDSAAAHAWYFFATFDQKQFAKENVEACARWCELEPDNIVPRLGTVALKLGKSTGDEPLPGYQGALLDELEIALEAPNTDFHLSEANAAIQRVISEARFPLPAQVSDPEGLLGSYLIKLGRGMSFRGKDLKIPSEQMEVYRRTHDVFARLAERMDGGKFRSGMTRMLSTVLPLFATSLEKALLRQEPGNEEAIATLEAKSKELNAKAKENLLPPAVSLQMLPLPSLQRAIFERDRESLR